MRTISGILTTCALLVFMSGCVFFQTSEDIPDEKAKLIEVALPFSDIPVADGFDFDRSRSFIYESGSGAIKVGRLYYTGWTSPDEVVTFYKNEMVNKGWNLINSLEQEIAVMNYEKEGWSCTIVIRSAWLGSQVEIQVGPK
ncbi:MAG: hypothetical protein V3U37_06475 [Nitrospinaceae bacterium]